MSRRSRSTGDLGDDWREFLSLLISHQVRFVVVGGHAVAVHASPRYTKDLDVFVDPTPANARRMLAALVDFGFGAVGLTEKELSTRDKVFMLGRVPRRIDILTGISGVRFAEAWRTRAIVKTSAGLTPVISLALLVRNKRAAARPQDLADAAALDRARSPGSGRPRRPPRQTRPQKPRVSRG